MPDDMIKYVEDLDLGKKVEPRSFQIDVYPEDIK